MINGVMFWSMCSSGDFFWPLLKIFLLWRSSTVCRCKTNVLDNPENPDQDILERGGSDFLTQPKH